MMLQETMTPSEAEIRAHLDVITARWAELPEPAAIELRALGENLSTMWQRFPAHQIDEAVSYALAMNRLKRNIYVVVNPIRATTPLRDAATDSDIIGSCCLWADADDTQASDNVRRFDGPRYSRFTVTGRTPHTRVHVYWDLVDWCFDMPAWTATQRAIAEHFKSDRTVVNPSRIMRLGGTITWPSKAKGAKGYVPEKTEHRTSARGEPVALDQLQRVFAPQAEKFSGEMSAGASGSFQIVTGEGKPDEWYADTLRRARTDGEKHSGVRDLAAHLAGSGVNRTLAEAIIREACPVWDRNVEALIASAYEKFAPTDHARIEAIQPAAQAIAQAPEAAAKVAAQLEWLDDLQPAIGGAYIVKGMLDAGAMSVIYGPSNSGKTFFALDLAFHLAIGAQWRGRRVKQCAVLYLAAEGGRGIVNRMIALRDESGVVDVPLAIRRAGLDLLRAEADIQAVITLAATVQAKAPGAPLLIVVDTLSRVMAGGDENSAQDMTALIRNIDAIRELTGAHLMLVHHSGKDTARGARGHSSLRAATDTEIEVSPPPEDGAPRLAEVTKQRDHNGGDSFAFTLRSVAMGTDEDGDEVTTCIVEVADSDTAHAAAKAKKGLGGNQKIIAETFDQMVAEGFSRPNPGGVGMPETGVFHAVDLDQLREIARGKMVASDTRSAFNQAMRALTQDRGLFVTGGNMAWRVDRRFSE